MSSHMQRLLIAALACAAALAGAAAAAAGPRARTASGTVIETHDISSIGTVIAAANGHTLYMFSKDTRSHSACTGACAAKWKPLLTVGAPTVKAGSKLTQSKVTTLTTAGAKTQVEYNGHPLYTYTGDTKAGQVNGSSAYQFGGYWYALNSAGKQDNGLAPIY